jgi:hypothetical protein
MEHSPSGAAERGPAVATDLVGDIFVLVADRLASREQDVAVFSGAGEPFADWLLWETFAAGTHEGWTMRPRIPYREVGVVGSRETADLLAFDPLRGSRVLVEMTIISDWTNNKWIDWIEGATARLSRAITPGIEPLQIVVAASPSSPLDVNPHWQQWLGMSAVWNRPTDLECSMPLGPTGQILTRAWRLGS